MCVYLHSYHNAGRLIMSVGRSLDLHVAAGRPSRGGVQLYGSVVGNSNEFPTLATVII